MKKILVSFIFFNFIFGALYAEEINWIKCEKQYIPPSQIIMCDEGIFVNMDNNYVRVNNVNYDSRGISFSEIESLFEKFGITYWYCPECDYKNGFKDRICQNCGYDPRNKNK